ncbi:MAG: BspA family leucine-rich repeat surface protein [Treponema sp.]|nr:BspA family leucine-rich repeat surface protein [Clostridia bacterium]MBP3607405.1 BspA family leucine-rich repeat surface protein [Treponema sp.]
MYIGYIKSNLISNRVSSFKVFGSSTNFSVTTEEECIIDFGDGTTQNISGTNKTITHNYSSEAEYIITITGNHSSFRAPSETIEAVSLSDTITNCSWMFGNCTNLTKISSNFTIPNSVTNCSSMFYNCSSLTEIPSTLTIPNSVTNCSSMFNYCTSLTTIPSTLTIPNSVTQCNAMFYNCSSLTEIPSTLTIPNSVTDCSWMFNRCSSLTTIPSTLTIPNSVTNCAYMFSYCSSLTTIPSTLTIPNLVTKCNSMFSGCTKLISDISNIFPSTFTYTGTINLTSVFHSCSKITGTAPADKLWNSGKIFSSSKCFYNCTSLANYSKIPAGWK